MSTKQKDRVPKLPRERFFTGHLTGQTVCPVIIGALKEKSPCKGTHGELIPDGALTVQG
jgi:hypothetical protein